MTVDTSQNGISPDESGEEFLHIMALGEDFLEHHGVKGMRWGVRKANAGSSGGGKSAGQRLANSKFGKASDKNLKRHQTKQTLTGKTHVLPTLRSPEKQLANPHPYKKTGKAVVKGAKLGAFAMNANQQHTVSAIANGARKPYREDLKRINAKPEYVKASKLGNRLRHPLDPTTKAYRKETSTAWLNQLEKSANSIHGVNGQYKYTIKEYNYNTQKMQMPTSQYGWRVSVAKRPGVHHAASDNVDLSGTFFVPVHMDADGFITDVGDPVMTTNSMAQSAMIHDAMTATPEAAKLKVAKTDHVVTQKVKQDHNTLSDAAFLAKYKVSKSAYRGRVAKAKGDPFAAAQKK